MHSHVEKIIGLRTGRVLIALAVIAPRSRATCLQRVRDRLAFAIDAESVQPALQLIERGLDSLIPLRAERSIFLLPIVRGRDGGAHVCAPQQEGRNKGVLFCVILPSEG